MDTKALYIEEVPYVGINDVVFIANNSGRKLVRKFNSPYLAKQFVYKCMNSKRVTLVSYPEMGF